MARTWDYKKNKSFSLKLLPLSHFLDSYLNSFSQFLISQYLPIGKTQEILHYLPIFGSQHDAIKYSDFLVFCFSTLSIYFLLSSLLFPIVNQSDWGWTCREYDRLRILPSILNINLISFQDIFGVWVNFIFSEMLPISLFVLEGTGINARQKQVTGNPYSFVIRV